MNRARHRVIWLGAGVLVVLAGTVAAVLIVRWALRSPVKSQAVYSGLTLLVATLALAAAVLAVLFALPGYREWTVEQRKRANMRLRLAIIDEADELERWIDEQVEAIVVPGPDFVFRANVRNEGDRILRWAILNIVVLHECRIEPWQGDKPTPIKAGSNDEIVPGQSSLVRFIAVERDFPPGHHYLTDVRISPPQPGDWPVLVQVEGDPPPRVMRRVIVTMETSPA